MGKLRSGASFPKKPGRHADGSGLYLLIKPTGGRSWLLRVQKDGQRRDIGLGSAHEGREPREGEPGFDIPLMERTILSLGEARDKARLLRTVAKSGRDPVAERDKDRRKAPTFREAAIAMHEAKETGWAETTAEDFLSALEEHAYPLIGNKRVDVIEATDIVAVLSPIWTTIPAQAAKIRRWACMVLDYSAAKNWRTTEAPRAQLKHLLAAQPSGGNRPAMPYAEVPRFIADMTAKGETIGRLALQFLVLTWARSGEVRKARWDQIDLEGKLWNRPAEIMKGPKAKRKPHTVTLSPQAIAVLELAAKHRASDAPDALIFPGKNGALMSDMSLSKIMRDAKLPYVPHGFRSSGRDWAAESMHHIPDPVAEAALAHVVPDAVIAAYKRTSFLDLRRTLLDAWGGYVTGAEDAGKVVQLAAARA